MKLFSTKNTTIRVSLEEAVLMGLPPDNGLYMPEHIPVLENYFWENLSTQSFPDTAFLIADALIGDAIDRKSLELMIDRSMNFPVPLVLLNDNTSVLELFHGPSLAFKDFGARFMAELMGHFNRNKNQDLIILVATSGDTGGAVAAGFHGVPGVQVVVLYPSGKVSPLQEKQLTTLGDNIQALEIDGDFDACQALVKLAFLDNDLRSALRLSSANSINIARLIPQSFYYFEAYKKAIPKAEKIVFSVPSGNYGNLSAGLIAYRMGLPVHKFIAASNANDIVPRYLNTGIYSLAPTIATISNAMDVGNPSNFPRMLSLFGSTWNIFKEQVKGYAFSDHQVKDIIQHVYQSEGYTLDPHTAVGFLAWKAYSSECADTSSQGIVLATAHPAKFLETVEAATGHALQVPERLASLVKQEKQATFLSSNFKCFKEWLLSSTWNN